MGCNYCSSNCNIQKTIDSSVYLYTTDASQNRFITPIDYVVSYFLTKIPSSESEQKLAFTPVNTGTVNLTSIADSNGKKYRRNWVLFTPASSLSTLTIQLPTAPDDKTELIFSTTNTVSTITWTYPSGYSGNGVPTTVTTTAPFVLKFDSSSKIWFKVSA